MTAAVAGLLLAAGGGRRLGRPKALLTDADGRPLAGVAVDRLRAAGCERVTVVLGAAAEEAATLLRPYDVDVVVADRWATGMGASLRRGLEALEAQEAATAGTAGEPRAVLVSLVDLPDVDERVMARVVDAWRAHGGAPDALLRAMYDGTPGHPVLVGRRHWPALRESLHGDAGARGYLAARDVVEVPCEDLATGRDVDRPEEVPEHWGGVRADHGPSLER